MAGAAADRRRRRDAASRIDRGRRRRRLRERPARGRCSRSTAPGSRSPGPRHRSASRQYTPCEMRYLRMLSNSIAAAALATSYVLALVLHLNPNLPLHPARLAPLVATVGLYYVVHLTVIAYILL